MKKLFILVSLLIILTINSFALNLETEVNTVKSEFEGKDFSGPLGMLFGNEKINVHITLNSGEELVIGLVTEDKIVKSISTEAVGNPGLNINTNEITIMQILNSDNSLVELKKALDEGKVTYQAVGFWKKIKFSFLSLFSKFSTFNGKEEVKSVEGETDDKVPSEQRSVDWYSDALEDMQELGCLDDNKSYSPENIVTRGEVAYLLACAFTDNDIPAAEESPFSDVSTGHESAAAIEYLASLGVVEGYEDNKSHFGPDDPLTREQFAKMVVEAYNLEAVPDCELNFSDMDETSDWYDDYVQTANCLSFIDVYPDGTFKPTAKVSWAEISTSVNRAKNYVLEANPGYNSEDSKKTNEENETSDKVTDDTGSNNNTGELIN